MPARIVSCFLAIGLLSSAATTLAEVTITARTDSVSAMLGNIQGPTPSDESISNQLLGLVDQTASVALSATDRSAITMASRVAINAKGFTAAVEHLEVDYSTERVGGGARSSGRFTLAFQVDNLADYAFDFDDQRPLLPFILSELALAKITPDSSRTFIFGSDGFFGSDLLGYFGERSGRLSAGTYELTASAGAFVVDDGFNALPIADSGEILDAFSFTVTEVPEPSTLLLAGLLGIAFPLTRKR